MRTPRRASLALVAWCCSMGFTEAVHAAGLPERGKPVNGLQAMLEPAQTAYRIGAPMPVRAVLRNVGATTLKLVPWCKPLQPPLVVVTITTESATLDMGQAAGEE